MLSPAQPMLPDLIDLHARWRGSHPAMIAPGGAANWAELAARCNRVARALRALGVTRGARVGIVMDNHLAMLESIFGALKAGAVVAPLNPAGSDASLDAMLRDADVSALIASPAHAARLAPRTGVARIVATSEGEAPDSGWLDYETLLREQDASPFDSGLAASDLCNIIYSSGTTGVPKGIAHDHGNRLRWAYDVALLLRAQPNMRNLIVTGLYSNISWAGMLTTLLAGGTLVVSAAFEPSRCLADLRGLRITHLFAVPVQYQRLLDAPDFDPAALATLQCAASVGSPLRPALKRRLRQLLPCGITDVWGLTEGLLTALPPEDAQDDALASTGWPLSGVDLRLLDAQDRDAAPGDAGEIVGRSRWPMSGYWRREAATREATWIDPEGRAWLRTGDIGRFDAQGRLLVVDRKKDMILSGGANVYPADLEEVLMQHPDVAECCVVGIASEVWGETPLAVVVPRAGSAPEAEALRAFANARLGKQQRIAELVLRESLPRNANGKVLKRELRDWHEARRPRTTAREAAR